MSYYSAAPVVASGKMKLWAGCNVPVLGYRYTEVDVEVFWIRKSELEVEFMHGGKSVKRLGTFNDFYCFMGSVQCIEDAKEAAAAYGVDSGSTAEIVATLRVFDEPVIKDLTREGIEHNKRADSDSTLKRRWSELDNSLRQAVAQGDETIYRTLEARPVAERVIWSSKSPDVDVKALAQSLREEFGPLEVV